jgi:hypothetical protein
VDVSAGRVIISFVILTLVFYFSYFFFPEDCKGKNMDELPADKGTTDERGVY